MARLMENVPEEPTPVAQTQENHPNDMATNHEFSESFIHGDAGVIVTQKL